ncbi:bcl-2-like protein 15 [Rhinatrema bivittatum]|uniref:bcl-2-like protein 15 n=1 Tax=Rhinatrema bivittatum TaxID=194408 RepID=UPI00112A195C|nr:bcl-2-like protein 15 [Rhinatrema bivittatum]
MRPFEEQTECIVKALLAELLGENEEASFRQLQSDSLGGNESDEDTFDPQLIATQLRDMGDRINKEIKEHMKQLTQDWGNEKVVLDFPEACTTISNTWTARHPEAASEMSLLSVTVALVKYVVNRAPQLREKVASAMTTFINSKLTSHIQSLGGWEHLYN